MDEGAEVTVCRLGHRPGRDERMTTHVALTARALGARRVVLPAGAADAADTAREVTDRFGGPFEVEQVESPRGTVRGWSGAVVHLTMYGEPIQGHVEAVREAGGSDPILAVVGAGKVPFEVYEQADWNLAVTNQPHSEVAALAVFLDRLTAGAALDQSWPGAERRVVPQATGKRVESVDEE